MRRLKDTVSSAPATLPAALLDTLRSATRHNRSDGGNDAVVLWTNKERHWKSVIPRLRRGLPLLTFGPDVPDTLAGPDIWLRCVIAGTLSEVDLPEGTPVIYLPGVTRADLRAVEDCPKEIQGAVEGDCEKIDEDRW